MWPFTSKRNESFAALLEGTRLARETRWSKEYQHPDGTNALLDSRFRDRSATISYRQLSTEWASWSDAEELDFCQSFCHYRGRNFAKMLRFIMDNGNDSVWSTIAMPVAMTLPTNEAVAFLCNRIENSEIGSRANYFQGCWITQSSDTIPTLNDAINQTWRSPKLMLPGSFCNWVTHDAIWCIDALARLGEPKEQLLDRYKQLSRHPTMGSQAVKWLAEHFGQ
tara:strand:- start:223 stop:891 length:669 start_codon:yes stop_codon:yes gene_type:complete